LTPRNDPRQTPPGYVSHTICVIFEKLGAAAPRIRRDGQRHPRFARHPARGEPERHRLDAIFITMMTTLINVRRIAFELTSSRLTLMKREQKFARSDRIFIRFAST
jgi:hypothetical protein